MVVVDISLTSVQFKSGSLHGDICATMRYICSSGICVIVISNVCMQLYSFDCLFMYWVIFLLLVICLIMNKQYFALLEAHGTDDQP